MGKRINPDNALQAFFSAPASTVPEQRLQYKQIIDFLIRCHCHITYNWLEDQEDYDSKSTTKKSIQAIEISDVLVAEITSPSTGVGQQIAFARSKNIPVITLQSDKTQPHEFFTNIEGKKQLISVSYSNMKNLYSKLRQALSQIGHERFVKFNFISTPEINILLEEKSGAAGISKSQLLRDIITKWSESAK